MVLLQYLLYTQAHPYIVGTHTTYVCEYYTYPWGVIMIVIFILLILYNFVMTMYCFFI
jgi:hypothetical protein